LEVDGLQCAGVNVLVSLLTKEEVAELMLVDEPGVCSANGIECISLPIGNRSVPRSQNEVSGSEMRIRRALREGKSVAIHCRVGIGRPAPIAASVLVAEGIPIENAFGLIRQARGCDVPDTQEQHDSVVRAVMEPTSNQR
jgi:protein-tyrosine phosphatase